MTAFTLQDFDAAMTAALTSSQGQHLMIAHPIPYAMLQATQDWLDADRRRLKREVRKARQAPAQGKRYERRFERSFPI